MINKKKFNIKIYKISKLKKSKKMQLIIEFSSLNLNYKWMIINNK